MDKVLVRNAVRCRQCGTVVESKYRHHYAECPCGACAVDGGLDYLKRAYSFIDGEPCYVELSEWRDKDAAV